MRKDAPFILCTRLFINYLCPFYKAGRMKSEGDLTAFSQKSWDHVKDPCHLDCSVVLSLDG